MKRSYTILSAHLKKLSQWKNLKTISKIKVSSLGSLICLSRQQSSHLSICPCLCAKSLQSCPTLCDPMDHSPPPGSSVCGIPEASPGVGCHALFQGIFLTQGLNSVSHISCTGSGFCTTSATREAYIHTHIHIHVGGGNGDPLQCSFLENPMHGGTWRAAVHGGRKE